MNKKIKIVLGIIFITVILIVIFATDIFSSKTADAAWYSTGGVWTYRKTISINHQKVATSTGGTAITNFPMLFSVTDPDLKYTGFGGKVASSTGGDILFTSADGTTLLDFEIEKYASTTGELVAWVEVPSLSSNANTNLLIYYGNASPSNTQNPTGVWDSNYKGVWHLPNGTTLTATDSTSNANNYTVSGGTAVSGKIDGGETFSNAINSIANNTSLIMSNGVTLEAWVYPKDATSYHTIFSKFNGTTRDYGFFLSGSGVNNIYMGFNGISSGDVVLSSPWVVNAWNHIIVTYNQTSIIIYLNGASVYSSNQTAAIGNNNGTLYTGKENVSNAANANMDELRISNTARSADWIKTEYNNQSSPSSFYSYGTEEQSNRSATTAGVEITSTATSGISGWYAGYTYRKKISVDHQKVASTTGANITGFPLLVSIADADLKSATDWGGKVASTTGGDILFTSANGTTLLDYEIEKYASTTGELVAWVEIPFLSSTSTTPIYMYIGNASASNTQNPTGVWDSNYKGVWHLPNGTTLNLNDSIGNDNLANQGTLGAETGKMDGGAVSTTDNSSYAYKNNQTGSLFANGDTITISAWTKRATTGSIIATLVSSVRLSNINNRQFGLYFTNSTANTPSFYYTNSAGSYYVFSGGTIVSDTTTWHYLVFSYTYGTGSTAKMYLDGNLIAGSSWTLGDGSGTVDSRTDTQLMIAGSSISGEYLRGSIDEVRISKGIARSADWIATEYNNQAFPNQFYSYGGLENYNGRLNSSGASTPAVKVRGGVKFR